MGKNSIARRIFLLLVAAFLLFLIIQTIFQTVFLGRYYEMVKTGEAEKEVEKLVEAYEKSESVNEKSELLLKYMATTENPIVVTNAHGYVDTASDNVMYAPYRMQIVDEEDRYYSFPLYDNLRSENGDEIELYKNEGKRVVFTYSQIQYYEEISLRTLNELLSVTIDGIEYKTYMDDTENILNNVLYDGENYLNSEDALANILHDSIEDTIVGNGVNSTISYGEAFNSSEMSESEEVNEVTKTGTLILHEANIVTNEMIEKNSTLIDTLYNYISFSEKSIFEGQYDVTNKKSLVTYRVILKSGVDENGNELAFFTLISLQSVSEITAILSSVSKYFFAIALILVVFTSLIISKSISQPIVLLSRVAGKNADMNFDDKYDDSRQDELGDLGRSLNHMSSQLKNKMDELEDVNKRLEADIEFERRQESIRKDFVANVSHELKTPLGVIKSFAEGIQDGISNDKADYYLDVIIDEIDKMNLLVVDMLELANMEQALNEIKEEPLDLTKLSQGILSRFVEIGVKKQIKVTSEIDDCIIVGDPQKIEQVVLNLVSNSFRYTIEGGNIHLAIKKGLANDKFEFSIYNTAVHLNDEEKDKIWDRFYRREKSRSRELGGNGLGLSIVKYILEKHELMYGVENVEAGIKFYFKN